MTCDTCGKETNEIHKHHVLPRVLGGTDADTNLVSICIKCHSLIHEQSISGSELIKKGLQNAKRRGVRLGGTPKLSPVQARQAKAMHESGQTMRQIAKWFGTSHTSVARAIKRQEQKCIR